MVVTYRTNARLGLEDFWDYESQTLVGGGTTYANLSTGNNIVQYTDFSLLGRGDFGLDFTRTYNSKSQESSVFGYGWTFTGNEKLFLNIKGTANILNYSDADGTDHEFTYNSNTGKYHSGPGKYLTITKSPTDSSVYTMEDKYGYKTTFKILQSSSDTNVRVANIQTQQDRHGNKITYTYDAANNNRIIKITSDLGNGLLKSINFNYGANGFVQDISFEHTKFTFKYDDSGNGRVNYFQQVDNSSTAISNTTFEYNDGLLSTVVDPNNRRTDFTYEAGYLRKVQPPKIINGKEDPTDRPGTSYDLNTITKTATVTHPEMNTTTYYMNDNYVVTKTVNSGITTTYVLDSDYNPLEVLVNGEKTTNVYDLNGNLLSTIDPEEHEQKFSYTTFSNLKTMTDSNNNTTIYTYDDSNGDLKTIEFPDGSKETYVYDSFGDLQSITRPDGSLETQNINYVSNQTTTTYIDSFLNQTTSIKDSNGNIISTIDGEKNQYTFYYNLKNELILVEDPMDEPMKGKTEYTYDGNGNLTSIKNPNKIVTATFEYDGKNQLVKETNALGKSIEYKYDNNGNLIETLMPMGRIQSLYDVSLNRLNSLSVNGITKWGLGYDTSNQITQVCKGVASPCQGANLLKTFAYKADGSFDLITDRNNLIDYTDLGSQQKVKYTVESKIVTKIVTLDYFMNEMNQLKEIQKTTNAELPESLVTFGYGKGGLPETVTYHNGSSIQMYYLKNRLDRMELKTQSTIFDMYDYEYDQNNNITKIISNAGTNEFTYDKLNQLITEVLPDGTKISYTYDKVGNRTSKTISKLGISTTINYQFNNANQLIHTENQYYSYDDNGNLSSDGKYTYVFNAFNELEEIKDKNSQATIAQYTYDEQGRRISSTTSSGTVNYFYDGNQVIYETNEFNEIIREYTYNHNGIPTTLSMNGVTYYYLYNHRGDVVALTNKSGEVVATYKYDAWGNILSQSGSMASENPYRYAGYRYDENTKLYYLIARYYNAENSVFLSKDPILGDMFNPISQNGYNYVNNNPVMMVDATGLTAIPYNGTFSIPGIGWVKFVGGVLIVRGMIISTGSWIYKKVTTYFKSQNYSDAKSKGKPTANHKTSKSNSLPRTGDPYSSTDLVDSKGVKQRRYYDKNGNADEDIDYRHSDGDGTHKFPHRHKWNGTTRGKGY